MKNKKVFSPLHLIKSLYYKGRDAANRDIRRVRDRKGIAAAMDYAHESHEHCDRTMNSTKMSSRYSYAVGQAGAYGWMAANGTLMPAQPKRRKGRR